MSMGATLESTAPAARTLSIAHRAMLMGSAIDPNLAQAFTVNTLDELPEELQFHTHKHGPGIVPGIVFEHVSVDGSVTYQLRPDIEPEDGSKYLFPMGASTGPFIHRSQLHLVGKLDRIVIVEGTKQFRAAVTTATEDGSIEEIMFVGLPGCNGGVKDHQHSNDWNTIIRDRDMANKADKGADIVVIFDADVSTKMAVWTAAEKLRKHLELTSGAKVRIADIPAYGKDGLDDYLAHQSEGRRSITLQGLIREAATKMVRRPSAALQKRAAGAFEPIVNFAEGVTAMPAEEVAGTKVPGRVLMPAAARIAKSYFTYNDFDPELKPVMTYDLEVSTKITGKLKEHTIRNLSEAELIQPRTWLNRIPGGSGANIVYDSRDAEKIVNAIRACSTQQMINRVERTGLIVDEDEVIRFMDSDGALGPEDKIFDLVSKIGEEKMRGVAFPNPHELSSDEIKAAYRHVLNMWDILVDPTAFLLVLGASVSAVHGLTPLGTYGSFGDTGSGKTTVFAENLSMFGPKAKMANFESTKGVIGQLGAGLENVVCFVDDFQDLTTGGMVQVQENNQALNKLLRRGYGGSEYTKTRLTKDQNTGRHEVEAADPSSPFFAVTMERNAIPYGMKSSMERLLLAEVTRANSFRNSEDSHKAKALAKSPLGHQAMAHVISLVLLGASNQCGDTGAERLAEWKDFQEGLRQIKQNALAESHPGMEPRSYEVAATPVYGALKFLAAAAAYADLEEGEYERREAQIVECIMAASFAWEAKVLNRTRGSEDYLARLTDAVAAGTHALPENWKDAYEIKQDNRVRVLGWRAVYGGQPVIVIVPSEASKILHRTNDVRGVEDQIAEHLVTDSKGNRKIAMTSAPGGRKDRLWCIKGESWNASAPVDDLEEPLRDDRDMR
ncbi:DUF3854 domain-containing protein [Arthrobacter sp. 162MFSha1.1]|uniref:DUF3854 domain-containing protein n=1 Tax=Arthrobacter sp. 162MFSha1.1 TaxID=1151119 RepID=UPI00037F41C7|nr:DUF3854 domain-containing protein [Arthrobacter sp. 162MFSha1.1]